MQLTPLKSLFSLFFPIFLATTISQLSLTIDSLMINQYTSGGTEAIGIASSILNIIQPTFFAIATGVNSFSVQYFARNKNEELKHLMGIAITILCPIILICFIFFLFFEQKIMSTVVDITTPVGEMALEYFSIIKWVIFLSPFEILFTNQYRAIRKPRVSLVIGAIQCLLNFIFNWILIFGVNGHLELGIYGAALATLLSKLAYIVINYLYSLYINSPFIGTLKEMFSFNPKLLVRVIKISSPLILVELMFGVSKFIFTKIFILTGVFGYGVYVIAQRISMTFNGLVIAPANVNALVMGEKLVSRDENLINNQLKINLKFNVIIGLILLFITLFVMPQAAAMFNLTDPVQVELIKKVAIINGVYMIIRIGVASIISILKSGGDNRFVIWLDSGITFIFTIPLLYFLAINHHGVIVLSLVLVLDMVIKLIVGGIRLKSDYWRNVL